MERRKRAEVHHRPIAGCECSFSEEENEEEEEEEETSPARGLQHSTSFAGTVDVSVALRRRSPKERTAWGRQVVAASVFGVLLGAALSVRRPWMFTIAGLVVLLLGGPALISSTYTLWNWTVLLGQVADRTFRRRAIPRLLPFLVVNSWAIFTSFNVHALFYRPHFAELAKRLDYSMSRFHLMNTVGHFLPPVIVTLWFWALNAEKRLDACEWTSVAPLPVASFAFHLLWALRVGGGLVLDHVYLKRPRLHWYIAWATAALTHLSIGTFLSDLCHS